jgi:hypothetical protein
MWTVGWMVPAFVAGYVASVFTWEHVHTFIVSTETKANELRARLRELEQKIGK